MKRILLAAVAATALMGAPVLAQNSTNAASQTTMSMANLTAETFVTMAASSDMFEIESSEAAQASAQDAEVKEFAEHMITDHTKASEKLMAIAKQAGVSPPTSMTADHAAMLTQVSAMSGDDFDKAYVEAQVMAHEQAVALFSAYAENGDNAELKAFAAETLPTLQEHLADVQELQSKVSS